MASRLRIDLTGFEKMLEELQRAGGKVDKAAETAVKKSAQIVESDLRAACNAAGVPASVSNEIKTTTEKSGNRYSAEVGWKLGAYNPRNLSAGYKAVFMNYGTIRRHTKSGGQKVELGGEYVTLGTNRGSMIARQFITAGKKASRTKVKKVQKQVLEDALKELT